MMPAANTGLGGHAQQGAMSSLTRMLRWRDDQTDQERSCRLKTSLQLGAPPQLCWSDP